MSEATTRVEVLFLWHHHQPDYRGPRDGEILLPWVRLHATKDYLDMALRLERHPRVRAAFNFVPTLLDQLEGAAGGAVDRLLGLITRPIESLSPAEQAELEKRCAVAPRHAFERWPRYRALVERLGRPTSAAAGVLDPADLLALEVWFLLAWLDPMFHDEPEARRALDELDRLTPRHRDDLVALGSRLAGEIVPAYRRLAERGQVELSASPYFHPILPLLVDLTVARRARPDLPLPHEPFAAPEDASRQIARAIERHERAFGARPQGMWPPEGSVSPEAVERAARADLRWLASDEGVLWRSLPETGRRRELLYRPWRFATPAGEVTLFFRDHELSDRIGFVYQNWDSARAVEDFIARLRRIGAEHGPASAPHPPLVSVILDGENCWERYPEDGGPFLEALYGALEQAPDITTRTPSEVLAARGPGDRLEALHSGSWIDADFHIWIGHPEKNRAWELVARARRALVEAGRSPEQAPGPWEALDAAEGSDWFWWFGDDHYTPEQPVFDQLFREHLVAVYERAGLKPPTWLSVPVVRIGHRPDGFIAPLGFVRPTLDGRPTQFYEWHAAGRYRMDGGGGAMHRGAGPARDLYYGWDEQRFYLRLDFADRTPPGPDVDLVVEFLTPRPLEVRVQGLTPGRRPVSWTPGERTAGEAGGGEAGPAGGPSAESAPQPLAGAECQVGSILELALRFESLGLAPGQWVELVVHLGRAGAPEDTLPADDLVRFSVPDRADEAAMWSA